jgi:hypothetical protein
MSKGESQHDCGRMLTITTQYEGITDEWLEWYIGRLEKGFDPIHKKMAIELREKGIAVWSSKDPESDVIATTSYVIDDPLPEGSEVPK